MVNFNTVLVLGAGASIPYGFPTADGLLNEVCSTLSKPETKLFGYLLDCNFEKEFILKFRNELYFSMQPSVDFFIESRPEYIDIGKLAIAGCLIKYENLQSIYRGRDEHWYKYLFGKMRTSIKSFHENKVSIITFNYDRSLEYFFITALKNSYNLNESEAVNILKQIPIIHIYGKLGGYPDIDIKNIRFYESKINPIKITKAAESIRLMNEIAEDDENLLIAQEYLKNAKVICFLGYGYHPINFDILMKKVKSDLKDNWNFRTIYGTAFDIGTGERESIKSMFGGRIKLGGIKESNLTYLRNNPIFIS